MPGRVTDADRARACELWNVRLSLDNLMTFPWVRSARGGGPNLSLHGWYFDLQSGELLEYDAERRCLPSAGRDVPIVGPNSLSRPDGNAAEQMTNQKDFNPLFSQAISCRLSFRL